MNNTIWLMCLNPECQVHCFKATAPKLKHPNYLALRNNLPKKAMVQETGFST